MKETVLGSHLRKVPSIAVGCMRLSEKSKDEMNHFIHSALEQGPARGKNAIALLGNMGIDEKIVKQAERRAAEFETTGSWEKNKFLR